MFFPFILMRAIQLLSPFMTNNLIGTLFWGQGIRQVVASMAVRSFWEISKTMILIIRNQPFGVHSVGNGLIHVLRNSAVASSFISPFARIIIFLTWWSKLISWGVYILLLPIVSAGLYVLVKACSLTFINLDAIWDLLPTFVQKWFYFVNLAVYDQYQIWFPGIKEQTISTGKWIIITKSTISIISYIWGYLPDWVLLDWIYPIFETSRLVLESISPTWLSNSLGWLWMHFGLITGSIVHIMPDWLWNLGVWIISPNWFGTNWLNNPWIDTLKNIFRR